MTLLYNYNTLHYHHHHHNTKKLNKTIQLHQYKKKLMMQLNQTLLQSSQCDEVMRERGEKREREREREIRREKRERERCLVIILAPSRPLGLHLPSPLDVLITVAIHHQACGGGLRGKLENDEKVEEEQVEEEEDVGGRCRNRMMCRWKKWSKLKRKEQEGSGG